MSNLQAQTLLASEGFLSVDGLKLEYRWIPGASSEAPVIVMLLEGLGSVGLWGDFPDKLQAATGSGIFIY
jgi:hypothetical protein